MRRYLWTFVSALTLLALLAGVEYCSWRSSQHFSVELDSSVYPVKGLDLSAHNGIIDFRRLAADSIDFVMLKATEGTTFQDPNFHRNYNSARDAGIKAVGAYHFFRFDTDGEMQAMNFLNSLHGKTLDLPAVIDIEEWGNPGRISTSDIVARLEALIGYLEQNGHNVMFYTNKDGYNRFLKDRFNDYPLWICSFSNPPLDDADDDRWSIWQYSHLGWAEGCDSKVDLNTFNGTREEWLKWMGASTF
ncbi:MAG: hypothetical protein HDS29_02215 [Bacteroides sp.]|nr:hypothetical protein [Bacteroides sp.]